MIQVNLIPDLKAEFLKAQRNKRVAISIATLVAAAFVAVVVLLFIYVNVVQKEHTDNLTEEIGGLVSDFQAAQDLDKIVTVQKQLEALPILHDEKPLISRLASFLTVITPEEVEFRSIDLSFESGRINMTGTAETVADANKFVNTVKGARYILPDDPENPITPFTNVILSAIGSGDDGTNFVLDYDFDAQLFLNHDDLTLIVEEGNSTLSETQRPNLDGNSNESDPFTDQEEGQ